MNGPVLRIGITSLERFKERTIAIARGERRRRPDEPKVWFASLESLAQVLSVPNRALLETIRQAKPRSLAELAEASGRAASNLSRTLHTMERYSLVRLRRAEKGRIVPEVPYDRLLLELPIALDAAPGAARPAAARAS